MKSQFLRLLAGALVAVFAVLLFALASLSSSCTSTGPLAQPARAWVEADRATWMAVAPKFSAYLKQDPVLQADPIALSTWLGLVDDWRLRIETLEAELGIVGKPLEDLGPPDPVAVPPNPDEPAAEGDAEGGGS